MAIKIDKDDENHLKLTIDNGELAKFRESLKKWDFKDSQSLLSFMISLVVLNEGKSFKIILDGIAQDIAPASELLKQRNI